MKVEQEVPWWVYFLLYFIEEYFGESEWALRVPLAVVGVLSVFVLYLLGFNTIR